MKLYIVLNLDSIDAFYNTGWGDINKHINIFSEKEKAKNWIKEECDKTFLSANDFIIIEKNI